MLDIIDAAQAAQDDEGIMRLKDDRWVMKVVDEGTVVMFAVRVTEEAMEEYTKGEYEKLGVRFPGIKDSIFTKTENVEMEVLDHKLHVRQQGYDAGLALTDPQYVSGDAQHAPDVTWAVEATGDISFIKDFVKRADSIIGASSFSISPRPNHLYLYAEEDNEDLVKKYPWEDFDDFWIDWSVGGEPPGSGGNIPAQDKACDTILSIDYAKELKFIEDEGTIHVDNHTPVKILFDTMDGVDASYFFSPRISSDDVRSCMPDSAAEPEDRVGN